MSAPELAEEYERHQETWSRWLAALSRFAVETDRHRAHLIAAEVTEAMPAAFRARLAMVELMPLEMRRRELEATQMRHIYKLGSGIPVRIEHPKDDERGGKS